jgi:hypothetical protein
MSSFLKVLALEAFATVTVDQTIDLYADTACVDFSVTYTCDNVYIDCTNIRSIGSYMTTRQVIHVDASMRLQHRFVRTVKRQWSLETMSWMEVAVKPDRVM